MTKSKGPHDSYRPGTGADLLAGTADGPLLAIQLLESERLLLIHTFLASPHEIMIVIGVENAENGVGTVDDQLHHVAGQPLHAARVEKDRNPLIKPTSAASHQRGSEARHPAELLKDLDAKAVQDLPDATLLIFEVRVTDIDRKGLGLGRGTVRQMIYAVRGKTRLTGEGNEISMTQGVGTLIVVAVPALATTTSALEGPAIGPLNISQNSEIGEKRPRRRRSPRRRDHSPNSAGSASPARRRGSTQSSDDVMSSLAKRTSVSESSNRNPPKGPASEQPAAEPTNSRPEIASEIGYVPRARTRSLSPYSKRRHLADKPSAREPRPRDGPKQGRPPFGKVRDKEPDRRGPPMGLGPTNARTRRRKQRRAADSWTTEDPRNRRSPSPRLMTTGPNANPTSFKSQEDFESASSVGTPEQDISSQQHTPDPYKNISKDLLNPQGDTGVTEIPPSPSERPEEHPPPPPSPPPPPPPDARAERDAALMPPPNAPRGPRSELSALEPPKPAPIDTSKGKVRFSMGIAGGKGKMPTGPRSQEFGIPRRLGTSANSVPVAQRKGPVTSAPARAEARAEAPPVKVPVKPAPPVPRVIISRKTPFHRIGLVGEGTYGQVFKARNWMSKELVALKRVRMASEKDGFPITAAREIKILQRLSKGTDNDKIIHLLDNMVEANGFYMIFEYMDHDLTGILNHPSFRLSPSNIKDLAHQFFSGLAHIHRAGILHRDIKSSNILVNSEGQLKIADFGLARQYDKMSERLNIEQHFTNRIITLWYRPVEILLGETEYTTGPDVWSGGCVFMELFTRKAIFTGTNEITQLDFIWSILGTPNPSMWPDWKRTAWYSMLRPEQKYEPCFERRFGSIVPADALALAQRIFTYDPKKRPKAEDVLQDPYFTANEPKMERTTALKDIEGEWHELESKKNRKKERERQTAAKTKAQP
ncbi:kinase subunit of RNA polymerase II carboxy-terminal domain kinase I [Orbilia blumenaviensis]|uniref:cyclin-dependent kinase n=1 Tax=Orbilia blumenaviensis TaxID=1796055 RepID=A0AAV9V1D1_9PEZI